MEDARLARLTKDVAALSLAVCIAAVPISVLAGGHGGPSQFIRAHVVGDRDPFVKDRRTIIPEPSSDRSYAQAYREDLGAEPDSALVIESGATMERSAPGFEFGKGDNSYRCSAGMPFTFEGRPMNVTAAHCIPSGEPGDWPGALFGKNSYALAGHAVAPQNYEEEGGGPYTKEYARKNSVELLGPIGNDVAVTSQHQDALPPFDAERVGDPNIGDRLCYFGRSSGWVCGDVIGRNRESVQEPIGLWDVKMYSQHGDSGSVVYRGNVPVGILSYVIKDGVGGTRFTAISSLGDTFRLIGRNGDVVL